MNKSISELKDTMYRCAVAIAELWADGVRDGPELEKLRQQYKEAADEYDSIYQKVREILNS